MAAPAVLYIATLTVFLFRPPALEFHFVDRIALGLLVLVVGLRGVVLHQSLLRSGLTWPMAGLAVLAIAGMVHHSSEVSTWSVLAAKFFVPFILFQIAGLVFRDARSLRWLERFFLIVLAYLSFVSVAHLVGAYELVLPPFILNESMGIHADRARGPFLQAVANGVTINMLALIAIECYRKRSLRGVAAFALLASLPLAIVATKTRGVWLSFAVSALWLFSKIGEKRLRHAALGFAVVVTLASLAAIEFGDGGRALQDRLQESGAVEFRMAAYRAGWEMFLERPLLGWGTQDLQIELARRIRGFQGGSFAVHNTYLDVLLEQGAVGLGLYLWLIVALFRLGRNGTQNSDPVVSSIRNVWPLLLAVYFVNATFVVMNYQFVNGLLFTGAGILAVHCSTTGPRLLRLR